MALTQDNRMLGLETPLGKDKLLLTSFHGREEISRLFQFQLEMISDDAAIKAEDIVGQNVTVSIEQGDEEDRYINGFVNSFVAGDEDSEGRRNYSATIVPWLWFLTQTADCRIFQEKKIPEIVEQIFNDLSFSDFKTSDIRGDHKKWEYCVQYRETDFDFVSRLLEQEGVFYFFNHEEGKHTLVLSDDNSACEDCSEKEVDYPRDFGSYAFDDHIKSWQHRYDFRPGKWAHTDYNFKTPSTNLMAQTKTLVKVPGLDKYEVYDYPGEYEETGQGDSEVKLRMEEEEVQHDSVNATSTCRSFYSGGKFKIGSHRTSAEEGSTFIITSVDHTAIEPLGYETGSSDGGPTYTNSFSCIPEAVPFRPARTTPKPIVQGVQTAIVTGPSGEEIYVDEFGRVKVQFHWDREGKKDEKTSVWMRVSQIHAGKNFGAIDIPRMGEEVIVSFLEGDPDRPIITGRVYHAENMPPFGLPDSKTISGLKSKTYKGEGYNEYVMDDTPGNELIREHGQFDKDSTIEHDLREHVLNDRSRDVTNDESVYVGNDRTKTVANNETLTVNGNRSRTVDKNETIAVGMARTHTVGAAEMVTVGGAQQVSVGAVQSVTVGANQSVSVGRNQSTNVGADQSIEIGGEYTASVGKSHAESISDDYTLTAGKNVTIDGGDQIMLKVGKANIVLKKDGTININGKDIEIDGSGKINIKAKKDFVIKGKKVLHN